MKFFEGKVVSAKMDKTVVVLVETLKRHPLYQKVVRKKTKFHVHDDLKAKKGDRVKIAECRPISKTKKWKVVEIIKKDKAKNSKRETKGGKS
jgi:small subunit ribosomal protein S17